MLTFSKASSKEESPRRSLVVLMRRSHLLKALRRFEGMDSVMPSRYTISELCCLCDDANRDDLRVALPWVSTPAMTSPGLLLLQPRQPFGAGTGTIMLPWHLSRLCRDIFGCFAPAPYPPPGLETLHTGLLDLNIDVLLKIDQLLLPDDAVNLRLCSSESICSLPCLSDCSISPLLLTFHSSDTISLALYSPVLGKLVHLSGIGNCIDLKNAELLASDQEWILLKSKGDLYILNLLNNLTRRIPPPGKLGIHYALMTLRVEHLHHVRIFGVTTPTHFNIFIGEFVNDEWVEHSFESNPGFLISSVSNPVCLGGRFYCLGTDGTVGTYLNGAWETFRMPDALAYNLSHAHLTSVGGHMVALLLGSKTSFAVILEPLDRTWFAVPGIQGGSLFTGTKQTIPWAVPINSFQNTIIVPRFLMKPASVPGFLVKRHDRWFLRSTEPRGAVSVSGSNSICAIEYNSLDPTEDSYMYRFGPGASIWITLFPDTRILAV